MRFQTTTKKYYVPHNAPVDNQYGKRNESKRVYTCSENEIRRPMQGTTLSTLRITKSNLAKSNMLQIYNLTFNGVNHHYHHSGLS